jgi:hypothetical protein
LSNDEICVIGKVSYHQIYKINGLDVYLLTKNGNTINSSYLNKDVIVHGELKHILMEGDVEFCGILVDEITLSHEHINIPKNLDIQLQQVTKATDFHQQ